MVRKKVPITLPGVDELFTSQEERDGSALAGVADIPLSLIDPFPGHPSGCATTRDGGALRRASSRTACWFRSRYAHQDPSDTSW